jgi:hypothetical protein
VKVHVLCETSVVFRCLLFKLRMLRMFMLSLSVSMKWNQYWRCIIPSSFRKMLVNSLWNLKYSVWQLMLNYFVMIWGSTRRFKTSALDGERCLSSCAIFIYYWTQFRIDGFGLRPFLARLWVSPCPKWHRNLQAYMISLFKHKNG